MNSLIKVQCPQHIIQKVVVVWVEILLSVRKVAVSNLGSR
jgi:hypothetical protein